MFSTLANTLPSQRILLDVRIAADGIEAIDAVEDTRFDAILMDVRMPWLDGIEATRRLRGSGLDIPIVALTADAVPAQRAECMRAGCSGYLSKPLDLAQLVTLLAASRAA